VSPFVLLASEINLDWLGLQPGQHEHTIIEQIEERQFVEGLWNAGSFVSALRTPAEASHVTALLGQVVPSTPFVMPTWRRRVLERPDDMIYVITSAQDFSQNSAGRKVEKAYYRIYLDPMQVAIVMLPGMFGRPSAN
jgi:hypothetical protein